VTSGRGLLLSGMVNLHRAYLLAGVEVNHFMAKFFMKAQAK
jgi:hypothetical protein